VDAIDCLGLGRGDELEALAWIHIWNGAPGVHAAAMNQIQARAAALRGAFDCVLFSGLPVVTT